MGCFDFTYADNGMNTRGGKGFLYLSNCFAKAARLQNPLRYSETDWYGRLSTPIGAEKSLVELDIYAIYGAMLNMADDASAPLSGHSDEAARYAQLIRERNFNNGEFEGLEDILRNDGIDYFFSMQCLLRLWAVRTQKRLYPSVCLSGPCRFSSAARNCLLKRATTFPTLPRIGDS